MDASLELIVGRFLSHFTSVSPRSRLNQHTKDLGFICCCCSRGLQGVGEVAFEFEVTGSDYVLNYVSSASSTREGEDTILSLTTLSLRVRIEE